MYDFRFEEIRMPTHLTRIDYRELNARQKENYNFQKVSAALADYGYVTLRLTDDWLGADNIALHINGAFLRVQLKSRLCFQEKYKGQGLHVVFPFANEWYLYDHDELLGKVLEATAIGTTESWSARGGYSFPGLSESLQSLLEPYRVKETDQNAIESVDA
jgi:hypothetical protein